MSLDLETLAEQTAAQLAGAAIGVALDRFAQAHPAVAEKAELGVDMLKRAIDMMPAGALHAFLTSSDAAANELIFQAARAAKLAAAKAHGG